MSLTLTTRIPTAQENLETAFFHTSAPYHQEALNAEYLRVRRDALSKVDEEISDSDAALDVKNFLASDDARRKASQLLAQDAQSPIVSKATQIAFLKSLMQDFLKGKKRAGLSALTALKAAETLNKILAYDAPIKQEVAVNHTVTCLPVIQAPFKGELPILRVTDLASEDGSVTSIALGDKIDPEVSSVSPETPDLELF